LISRADDIAVGGADAVLAADHTDDVMRGGAAVATIAAAAPVMEEPR
jgi:hypothetical protein